MCRRPGSVRTPPAVVNTGKGDDMGSNIPRTQEQFREHFLSQAMPEPNTGCSLWTGATTRGYGSVRRHGRALYAHRVAYELFVGPIPDGMHVLHHCDTPPCVNPEHLFLGTDADNIQDMDRKGRRVTRKGELHPRARLTEDDVRTIRSRVAAGETKASLSREHGVDETTVGRIVCRKNWAHVHDEANREAEG